MASVWITAFLLAGAVFGLAIFRIRHLFSEGPSTPPGGAGGGAAALLLWVCIAATLWPVLALSGVYSAWRRQLRRATR